MGINFNQETVGFNNIINPDTRQLDPQILSGQSLSYPKNISKEEFNKSISNILKRMDEIVNSIDKQGDERLNSNLSYLRQHFRGQVEIYNVALSFVEQASEGLNNVNPEELAHNIEELNNNMFLQHSFGCDIVGQAREFFQVAGVEDSGMQMDMTKIAKYMEDTRDEIELGNGRIIRSIPVITKDLNPKYLSYERLSLQ